MSSNCITANYQQLINSSPLPEMQNVAWCTSSQLTIEREEARKSMIEELDTAIDFSVLVRAGQALDWLTPIVGGRAIAKAEIADLMRDGVIAVFAVRAVDRRAKGTPLAG